MKFQNSIYLILIGLSIISCGNDTINLDYGKLEFPEHEVIDEAILDEIKQNQNRLNELSDQDGVHCKTDKDVYHYGETIGLTIENNTSDPVYFFPDDTEGLRSYYVYNLQSDKEYYREYLVSENPGFLGNITYHDPYTVYLHFSGVDKLTANELNINRFEHPLDPGDKFTFNVTMPNRFGYYQFAPGQFSHDNSGIGIWGLNEFISSNYFEIVAD